MYPKAREAILKHRGTLLKLAAKDQILYLLVSAPLYEKQLIPKNKHKEIRDGKSSNIERVDALLEWLEDSVAHRPEILDALAEGIKKSDNIVLARRLKKDAKGENDEPLARVVEGVSTSTTLTAFIKQEKKPKKIKEPKVKLPKVEPGSSDTVTPKKTNQNGMKAPSLNTPKSGSKKKKDDGVGNAGTSGRRNSKLPEASPLVGTKKGLIDGDLKVLSPAATPGGRKRPAPASAVSSAPTFNPEGSMWGYRKKENLPKSQTTIQAANKKLDSAVRAFTFRNDAVTLTGFQLDRLFYDGCGHILDSGFCSKKVNQKGNRYVCSSKHESEGCLKVPRLQLTLDDGTGKLDATVWKTSVEILANRATTDLEKLSEQELRHVFQASQGKKFSVYVESEKISKRDLKKANGKIWNLNATILAEDNSPPAKKRG